MSDTKWICHEGFIDLVRFPCFYCYKSFLCWLTEKDKFCKNCKYKRENNRNG